MGIKVTAAMDVGSRPITVVTKLTRDEFLELRKETQRVFILKGVSWSEEDGKATLSFTPGNGTISTFEPGDHLVHYSPVEKLEDGEGK